MPTRTRFPSQAKDNDYKKKNGQQYLRSVPTNNHDRSTPKAITTASAITLFGIGAISYGVYRLSSWWKKTGEENDLRTEEGRGLWFLNNGAKTIRVDDPDVEDDIGWEGEKQIQRNNISCSVATSTNQCLPRHRCHLEIILAYKEFLPTLRQSVEALTDTNCEVRALKKIRKERRHRNVERCGGVENVGGGGNNCVPKSPPSEEVQGGNIEEEKEESALWESVKVKSIARMIALAYSHCLLYLLLFVQVHLLSRDFWTEQHYGKRLSGRGKNDGDDNVDDDSMEQYRMCHNLVLQRTYGHRFFSVFVPSIVHAAKRSISRRMSAWDVMTMVDVSCDEFGSAIDSVRWSIPSEIEQKRRMRSSTATASAATVVVGLDAVCALLVPDDDDCYDDNEKHQMQQKQGGYEGELVRATEEKKNQTNCTVADGPLNKGGIFNGRRRRKGKNDGSITTAAAVCNEWAQYIVAETWDIVEGPAFSRAFRDCLEQTFELMRGEVGWGSMFRFHGCGQQQQHVDDDRGSRHSDNKRDGNVAVGRNHVHGGEAMRVLPLATALTGLKNVCNGFYRTCNVSTDNGGNSFREGAETWKDGIYLSSLDDVQSLHVLGELCLT